MIIYAITITIIILIVMIILHKKYRDRTTDNLYRSTQSSEAVNHGQKRRIFETLDTVSQK